MTFEGRHEWGEGEGHSGSSGQGRENRCTVLEDNEEDSVVRDKWQRGTDPEAEVREVVGGADRTESFRKNTGFHASEKGQ